VFIDKKENNESKREAYLLAKAALRIPAGATSFEAITCDIQPCTKFHQPVEGKRKVHTELEIERLALGQTDALRAANIAAYIPTGFTRIFYR
jgi:hypothetical protein